MEDIIRAYFKSWLHKDDSVMRQHFHEQIIYTECYGPRYLGKKQCLQWFHDWNDKGSVLKWDILKIDIALNTCYVTWYFECEYEKNVEGFDGISVICFDSAHKITVIDEYKSDHEHYCPYKGED